MSPAPNRKPATAPASRVRVPGARARRPGRGALVVIACLLFASSLVRLGGGTGGAVAREIGALVSRAEAGPHRASAESPPGLEDLLAAIRAREARVAEAEQRLAERERALELAEEELRRGLAELAEAEAGLEDLLRLADTAAEDDVARLTAVYEAMKPAEAAAVFDQMDPAFAAGLLGRMRADAAASVLAGLPPEKAYALSVVLAGRNAGVAGQ